MMIPFGGEVMSICKRIISAFMAVVITFMLFAVPKAEASLIGEAAYAYTTSSFAQWVVGSGLTAAGYYLGGTLGTIALPGLGTVEGSTVGTWLAQGVNLGFNSLMEYLAEYPVDDSFLRGEGGFVDGLDRTDAGASIVINSFVGLTSTSGSFGYVLGSIHSAGFPVWEMLEKCGVNEYAFIFCGTSSYLFGLYFDETGRWCQGQFKNPLDSFSSGLCTLTAISDLELVSSRLIPYYGNSSAPVYYSQDHAEKSTNFATSACAYIDFDASISNDCPFSGGISSFVYGRYKGASSIAFTGDVKEFSITWCEYGYSLWGANYSVSRFVEYSLSSDFMVMQPTGTDSGSRTSSLMRAINNYNITNNYEDNSGAVNFYLGTQDATGAVTNLYAPVLYDEETLIFTEPTTGTEYQTTGWTYDYTTRSYDITLDSGTMTMGGSGVTRIVLTYGDDAVSVAYYNGSTLIQKDVFAYVMATQSMCNIDGHSYTYETVKEPTCVAAGERKYTCSVCGDEYAEDIPTSGHSYEYSIYQEPTCTAAGIGLYTCPTCGDQYTEPIQANGHVSELIEYVPTVYDENGIVVTPGYSVYSCSVCGSEYTVADEIPLESEGWFDFMGDLLKSFIKSIVTTLAGGLSKLFSAVADLFGWFFDFLSDTVLSGIKGFFESFSDDSSIFDGFKQENEDGSTIVVLPSGVATVFQFASGVVLLLPEDLRLVLIFGIAALFAIAVFKFRP